MMNIDDIPQYTVYRGVRNMRGSGIGLGNAFGYLKKLITPFIKKKLVEFRQDAKPLLEEIGKSVVKGTSNVATDLLEGKKFKESTRKRFEEFEKQMNDLSEKSKNMEGKGLHSSYNTPIKRKKSSKTKSTKRKRDIFDLQK